MSAAPCRPPRRRRRSATHARWKIDPPTSYRFQVRLAPHDGRAGSPGVCRYPIEDRVGIDAEWHGADSGARRDFTRACRPSRDPLYDALDPPAYGGSDGRIVAGEPKQNVIDVSESVVCIDDPHSLAAISGEDRRDLVVAGKPSCIRRAQSAVDPGELLRCRVIGIAIHAGFELARKIRKLVLHMSRPAFSAFENVGEGTGFHDRRIAQMHGGVSLIPNSPMPISVDGFRADAPDF